MASEVIQKYQALVKSKKELEVAGASATAVFKEKESQWEKYTASLKVDFSVSSLEELKALYSKEVERLAGVEIF